ncbi:F-box domain [Arabidopsis thaliana x Arabidopsis arenosa]|uniref:F-box domain n=1 Tax=Arabidopsis thaliana x Arabidopsis arenosa TaxID=1240361 RepID=A0A8T2C3R0_9BRAS|nr:F-box domain [Arabidopsis thaliana x Arabidopsis arenosa]
MRNLEQQETQSPNSGRYIPIDLLMEIFSRVPATTIARFHCVSKLWGSILCRQDFTELFLNMSMTRPRLLLFTFQAEDNGNIFFFSSPLPQNTDQNMSLVPTRYHVHHKNSPREFSSEFGSPLRGFICCRDKGSLDTMVIYNPVTGESLPLPKVELKSVNIVTRPYLGYDPIDKQLKVLCIKFGGIPDIFVDHQVLLTLNNGKHLWRTIQCKPHYPISNGICIDDGCMLMTHSCTLINYKGKLGALQFTYLCQRLEFWILEDAEKYIWSKDIYTLPSLWDNIVQRAELFIVGMTGRGEVVLSEYCLVEPCYIYYFNLESRSLTRVQIQGLEVFKRTRVYTSLDYAENLKFM